MEKFGKVPHPFLTPLSDRKRVKKKNRGGGFEVRFFVKARTLFAFAEILESAFE